MRRRYRNRIRLNRRNPTRINGVWLEHAQFLLWRPTAGFVSGFLTVARYALPFGAIANRHSA